MIDTQFGAAGLAAAAFVGAFFGLVIGFVLARKFLPDVPSADAAGSGAARDAGVAQGPAMDGAGALKVPLRDEDLESTFVGDSFCTSLCSIDEDSENISFRGPAADDTPNCSFHTSAFRNRLPGDDNKGQQPSKAGGAKISPRQAELIAANAKLEFRMAELERQLKAMEGAVQ